jgi:hypothetical protein
MRKTAEGSRNEVARADMLLNDGKRIVA